MVSYYTPHTIQIAAHPHAAYYDTTVHTTASWQTVQQWCNCTDEADLRSVINFHPSRLTAVSTAAQLGYFFSV